MVVKTWNIKGVGTKNSPSLRAIKTPERRFSTRDDYYDHDRNLNPDNK